MAAESVKPREGGQDVGEKKEEGLTEEKTNGVAEPGKGGDSGSGSSEGGDACNGKAATTTPVGDPEAPISVKHPLQNSWTMWYDNPGRKTSKAMWSQNLKKVLTFQYVEDFWGMYNNIVPASKLSSGSNYHLFKEGIEPSWEHKENTKGGKWVANVPTKDRIPHLDKRWLWTILACIGEAFPAADHICGVVVSIRKSQDRLSVWTKFSTEKESVVAIGSHFKTNIVEVPDMTLGYQAHEDALRRDCSFNNRNRYEC
mmetsp:Transcript_16734/g.47199  ORF Transcript_16734/g.47199 Transcript_16734/m.47199 type:complete len:256 (+) Transcript_16734:311-1078(+)|eukprot:CAMPEP_0119120856 /NCGR_PEP_ID=MMETSP1310-20130426/1724_1 /TAXON_ID=464262 /ORGANISM="Genus nov. species nov., Strain RCC2339" /LENGTH=255 /DNA_ID=CAMNT_0007110363 /DNA_START=271 /DNA_END=1041 /DNA_ORIENTATION=-